MSCIAATVLIMLPDWQDPTVIEAVSWRLASELHRRHPSTTRLLRWHPGGGQSDCLSLRSATGEPGDIRLNRNGTIQVTERFDGRAPTRLPTPWDDYLRADPRQFLHHLEADAGLPTPSTVPASTPRVLTARLLAAILATTIKTPRPLEVVPGYIDTSGYGGGRNTSAFAAFPDITPELLRPQPQDLLGESGYRFWFLTRNDKPIFAVEQAAGLGWTRHTSHSIDLMGLYTESRRDLTITALKLLRRIENI